MAHAMAPTPNPRPTVRLQPVRRVYEQVADQLRELILHGGFADGDKLPSETQLAADFGVSRTTIREALRVLVGQGLVRTIKGVNAGSYACRPSIEAISETIQSGIALLADYEQITLDEFLQARALIEVPAVRLLARRAKQVDFEPIESTIPGRPAVLTKQKQFEHNRDFHSEIVKASGNTLIYLAAQPIFAILQRNLARSSLGQAWYRSINEQHREIIAAIRAGDVDAAGQAMEHHLSYIRPAYERAWRDEAVAFAIEE